MLSVRQAEYRAYLATPIWKAKRELALSHYGCICNRCKEYGNDVHHKTYERVGGNERIEDLEVLCRECHEVHHSMERKKRVVGKHKKGVHRRSIYGRLTEGMKRKLCGDFGIHPMELFSTITYGNGLVAIDALQMLGRHYVHGNKRKKKKNKKTQVSNRYGLAFVE